MRSQEDLDEVYLPEIGIEKPRNLRKEYLDWCKGRALELVELGQPENALASMVSDMGKWKGDESLYDKDVLTLMLADGMFFAVKSKQALKRWIEGFG